MDPRIKALRKTGADISEGSSEEDIHSAISGLSIEQYSEYLDRICRNYPLDWKWLIKSFPRYAFGTFDLEEGEHLASWGEVCRSFFYHSGLRDATLEIKTLSEELSTKYAGPLMKIQRMFI